MDLVSPKYTDEGIVFDVRRIIRSLMRSGNVSIAIVTGGKALALHQYR
jgi:hypothetical protein